MNVDFSCINSEITSVKQKTLGKRGFTKIRVTTDSRNSSLHRNLV